MKSIAKANADDCIHQILQLNNQDSPACELTPIQISSEVIEPINSAHYIAVFPRETKIQISCAKSDLAVLKGTINYFMEVPKGCSFQTPKNRYSNNIDVIHGQPLLLPEIKINKVSQNHFRKIDINEIPLDKIHLLQKEQNRIRQISLQPPSNNTHLWYTPLWTLGVVALIIMFFKIRQSTSRNQKLIIPATQQATFNINTEEDE